MKRIVVILTLAALVFCGCRKEADYHPYIGESGDLAYNSYSSQFDYLWKCMSTGYVFWDVDETDWDAVYAEYMPKFLALDVKHKAGQDVTLAELETLYRGVVGGLKDHHRRFTAGGVGGLGVSYALPDVWKRVGGPVLTLDVLYYYDFVSHHKGYPHLSDPRYLSTLSITLGVAFCF